MFTIKVNSDSVIKERSIVDNGMALTVVDEHVTTTKWLLGIKIYERTICQTYSGNIPEINLVKFDDDKPQVGFTR